MATEEYRRNQGVATMADADLLLAVINGRLPEVKSALDAGVSPDLRYSTGTTLIESACLNAFPFGDDAGARNFPLGRFQRRPSRPRNCPESGRLVKACLAEGESRASSGRTERRLDKTYAEARASVTLTH